MKNNLFLFLVTGAFLMVGGTAFAYHSYFAQVAETLAAPAETAPVIMPMPVEVGPVESFKMEPAAAPPRDDEERDRGPFINLREIRDITRQVKKDLLPQINRLIKQMRKKGGFDGEVAKLNVLVDNLNRIVNVLNSPADNETLREAIDDFHGENYWEQFNVIRENFELPKRINEYNREIKRLEKRMNTASVKKAAVYFGLTMPTAALEQLKTGIQSVQSLFNAGNIEDAAEAMREFDEIEHPGGINGLLDRFRGTYDMVRRIKNQSIVEQVRGILRPIIEQFNNGEYRELHDEFNEVENDIRRLIDQRKPKPQANLLRAFR